MKSIYKHLQYFFYLGWNWNFRLATMILYHEVKGESKYGISSIGKDDLTDQLTDDELENASIYQPINYYVAEWLFDQLGEQEIRGGAFLDAGCGKGRAMAMAAYYGFHQVYGFDFSEKLLHDAKNNLDKIRVHYPNTSFRLSYMDAKEYPIPDEVSVIFLFNPFNKKVMQPFIENVQESLQRNPRKVVVLYANPECRAQWLTAGFEEIKTIKKLTWLQGAVFEYLPKKEPEA